MSSQDFLVEIGTEELPPKALASLSEAFSQGILDGLSDSKLAYDSSESFASPRRLALLVRGLQLQAESEEIELLGPPADRAKDEEGNWTGAASGFARKQGVEPEQLDVVDTEKGPRLAYRSTREGVSAETCLPELVNESLKALPIPKRMRWGAGRDEFVRPVHWIVCLLGTEVIDCTVMGLVAGNTTKGHRFHSSGDIVISAPAAYEATLEEHKVIARFDRRQQLIREQIDAEAASLQARAVVDPELLDEVTALVEWPVALTGRFEERFLSVPAEALVYSMKEHQKYFHLEDASGELLPNFITLANIESKDPAQVIDGNERVIRPRLADADFFYQTDLKTPLVERVEQLNNVVFQQKLGTLHDKTTRLQKLAAYLAGEIGADASAAARAGTLAKADLVTLMVGEFADMQGTAGRYYALNDGEDTNVADALQQQYWPRYAGDRLPENPIATALALADRLDTLVGIFGIGQPPTGSKDPFALRRASLGVLRILVEGELALDLSKALQTAIAQYPDGVLQDETATDVMAYMIERFRAWYVEDAIPVEVFNAVAARELTVPTDINQRVHAVHAFSQLPQAQALAAANKRVSNILSKQSSIDRLSQVSEGLLTEAAEQALYQALSEKQATVSELYERGAYTELLASLADLQAVVDNFFDDVMVMADDAAVRDNRLALLSQLRDLFLQVADISQLVVSR